MEYNCMQVPYPKTKSLYKLLEVLLTIVRVVPYQKLYCVPGLGSKDSTKKCTLGTGYAYRYLGMQYAYRYLVWATFDGK